MAHWSVIDEPESPAGPEPATAERVAAERSPIERIAEIVEAMFLKEPDLTTELLVELGRADTATLAKLFGVSAPPSAELLPAKPGPTWSLPVSETPSRRDEEPRWDSNGYRLNPPPRNVFPRPEPRGGALVEIARACVRAVGSGCRSARTSGCLCESYE